MAKFYVQQLANVASAHPPDLAPLAGHKLAAQSRLPPIARAQDRIPALGRRVVLTASLNGEIEWLVPDTDPDVAGSQTHPTTDLERIIARGHAQITPGCCLALSVTYAPSGQSQIAAPGGGAFDFLGAGSDARVLVRVVWTAADATTSTTTHEVALDPSPEEFAGQPESAWAAIRVAEIPIVFPPTNTPALAARWSSHIGAEMEIVHIGGCRVIDACVHETPFWVARDSDADTDTWTSHLYGAPDPEGLPAGGTDYAWQRWSEDSPDGRPQGGAWHMLDVAHAQGLRLGPALLSWTSYSETGALPADDDVHDDDPQGTTSATFVGIPDATLTAYDATGPGWTLGSVAHARDADENDAYWCGEHGSTVGGSIPVLVAVYASGDTGVLRLQSSPSSWIDVPLVATEGWQLGYGHLECGVGPGDERTVQAFLRRTGSSATLTVSALSAYRLKTEPR